MWIFLCRRSVQVLFRFRLSGVWNYYNVLSIGLEMEALAGCNLYIGDMKVF